MSTETHFGFKTVDSEAKSSLVKGVFNSVASQYDLMNDLMSGGLHRYWKQELIRLLSPSPNSKLLDVAGGTGDIAFRFLKKLHQQGEVTVCDINENMLLEGKKRAIDNNHLENLTWVCGNAESLPLPDSHYDYYTIAFGIRNVTHINKALEEAYRVLRPGGKFMCLEFSKVTIPLLAKIYDTYSFEVIPKMGELVANDKDSYQYLVESIRKFPCQEEFATMIGDAGFANVKYKNLSGGIVAIHYGWRI